jgi:hypothetical protein
MTATTNAVDVVNGPPGPTPMIGMVAYVAGAVQEAIGPRILLMTGMDAYVANAEPRTAMQMRLSTIGMAVHVASVTKQHTGRI